MQSIPTNDNVIGYVIAALFLLVSTLVGLVVWLFKGEMTRMRDAIHRLGDFIQTITLESIKAIGRTKKDD